MQCNAPLGGIVALVSLTLSLSSSSNAGASADQAYARLSVRGSAVKVYQCSWTSCCAIHLTDASAAGCSPRGESGNAALSTRPSGQHGVLHCLGLCPTVCRQAATQGVVLAVSSCAIKVRYKGVVLMMVTHLLFALGCAGGAFEPTSSPGERVQGL